MEIRAVERTMRSQITAVMNQIKALNAQLTDARIALEKETNV